MAAMNEVTAAPANSTPSEKRTFFEKWTPYISLAAGIGVSVAVGQEPALWEALSAPFKPIAPGAFGFIAWQWLFQWMGLYGIVAAKAIVALLMWFSWKRVSGQEWAMSLTGGALFVAACALMPAGPDAIMLPALIFMATLPTWAACCVAFLLPPFSPLYLFAALAALIWRLEEGRGREAVTVFVCAVVSPWGAAGIISGRAFAAIPLMLIGDPSYNSLVAPLSVLPLVLWTVAIAFVADWENSSRLIAGGACSFASILLRPIAALAPIHSARCRVGSSGLRRFLLLLFPVALALRLFIPCPAMPRGAERALGQLPRGKWKLLAEPAWSGRSAFLLSSSDEPRIEPRAGFRDAMRFWMEHPGELTPPFADEERFDCDVLLISPRYPASPAPRPLQPGWILAGAGQDYAIFVKQTPPLATFIEKHGLDAYDPFEPLPSDRIQRQKALSEALGLLRDNPKFFEALRDAGRVETDFGKLDEAFGHLQEAARIKPGDAQIQNDLGVVLQKQGRPADAERAYLLSIKMNPQELLPRLNLAGLYADGGQWPQAELVLKDMIGRREGFYPAYRMLIQVLLSQGKNDEARSVALSIPPDSRTPDEAALAGSAGPPKGGEPNGRR